MTELERALVALGSELGFPATPDVWPRVAERLARRRWLRPAVFSFAVIAVSIGIAFAVPPARSAILRFLHIGNATIERVETLPPAQQRPLVSGLGPALAQPTLKLPKGIVATRYYKRPGLTAALLRYHGKAVLLAEIEGDQVGLTKKLVGRNTSIEEVQIGEFGVWISGAPHVVMWQFAYGEVSHAETRLAGDVLEWLQNGVTYRLEGELSRDQMVKLARQITP